MPLIRVLDDQTINQIAAGEVIENSASVIKELVENSLDSGATEITVEIKAGGRQLIRIVDNGCGMTAEEALLALQRHATSKIQKVADLELLATMGFRGEALPSIASISKMSILTCNNSESEANVGVQVSVEGGAIVQQMAAARSRGTTIEVKSLFFNVPVRQKFQKSIASDTAEAYKLISALALANPDIQFTMISDQKELLRVGVNKQTERQRADRLLDVLGLDFFQILRPIDIKGEEYHFSGFIGSPNYVRHNRTGQYLFINRRPVIVSSISVALKEGYGTRLATQRYPVCVLYLDIPSHQVDVNVHPQKREVRLRQEGYVKNLLITGVEKALRQSSIAMPSPSMQKREESPITSSFTEERAVARSKGLSEPVAHIDIPIAFNQPFVRDSYLDIETKPQKKETSVLQSLKPAYPELTLPPAAEQEIAQTELFQTSAPVIFKPQLIGFFGSYLLLQSSSVQPLPPCAVGREENGILIVDLSGAQARVLFEQMMQQAERVENTEESVPKSQTLLLPLTIELSSSESMLLADFLPDLQKVGIAIRSFGERTFLIDSLPLLMKAQDMQSIISEMLESLQHGMNSSLLQQKRQQQIAMAACRSIGMQKRPLQREESLALVEALLQCKCPYESPFGRSIWSYWSVDEIEKKFKR